MEPERKIEKNLRAYAQKRRADAVDPLKLHPGTRRLLQGEVALRTQQQYKQKNSMTLWELFRQRWAFIVGSVAVVLFATMLFLPTFNNVKSKAERISAMNNLKQIGEAAYWTAEKNNGKLPVTLDALTNQLASDKILTDPVTGQRFVYIAGGKNLSDLPDNSVIAFSPAEKKARAVLFADGSVLVMDDAKFSELTNRGITEFASAKDSARRQLAETPATVVVTSGNVAAAPSVPRLLKSETDRRTVTLSDSITISNSAGMLAVNSPASAASTLAGRATEPARAAKDFDMKTRSVQFATAAQNFKNYNSSAQNSFKNILAPGKDIAVLANFQVQQNGSAIRVVDADGSVYDGALQPENAVAQTGLAPARTLQVTRDKTSTSRDKLMAEDSLNPQNYFFRVAGTNLTLKKNVVFAGNLLANSRPPLEQQQSLNDAFGESPSQSTVTNQLPWSNSHIAGTAVVDDTNNIEINAEPQAP